MMVLNEAICNKCKNIFDVSKKANENWSDLVFICPKCDSSDTRLKFGLGDIDVAVGIHGNGHTKYDREFTYKPSRYGKFKGKKVK